METLELLWTGLVAATHPTILLGMLFGVVVGLVIGALPGLGPAAGVAILLPVVVSLDGTAGMAALAGVYYGAMYGGAVTSILLGIPGDAPSVMTVADGYPLARQGHAGRALGMAIYASFIGGLIGLIVLVFVARQIARAALAFGPAEMTGLMVMALCLVSVLGGADRVKSFVALALGLMVGMVGLDSITGAPRFTLGSMELLDGFEFSVIAVGLFGLGQMFAALDESVVSQSATPRFALRSLMPDLRDLRQCRADLLRGSVVGFIVGILPGVGATAATILSYAWAKRASKTPERFGKGALEGVAAPEAANNAASYAAMVPLLTLGIPGSATTAIMMGGLLMFGLQPGPRLFTDNPEFVWTLIGTFWIGNIALVFITILMTPLLASVIFLSRGLLYALVSAIVVYGVYSIGYSMADLWVCLVFGVLGYIMAKLGYAAVPMVLGLVLGPLLELGIRRTLIASGGNPVVFFERPIALAFFIAAALLVFYPWVARAVQARRHRGDEALTRQPLS
ncbi:tripartite tricarboxylate transporter permease [Chelatococcus sp. GCM10030263]|uniref:tripartite tricarboxylate transporter permease n=1 Tax=Chelatococcus sp. GCM10030263 TaxID=3273387 RepID=UPI0036132823